MLKTHPSISFLIENITNTVLENSVNTAFSSLTGPIFSIRLWSVGWTLNNDFSAHGGHPMEAISSEQSQKRPKPTWPRVSHPEHSRGQQHGTGHGTFMKLSQSFTAVWETTHNRNRLVARVQQRLWPWKHTHPFLLLFAIWSPECFLDARGSWLHLQTCAIKGVRMRRSPRFAERRFDLMIWAH